MEAHNNLAKVQDIHSKKVIKGVIIIITKKEVGIILKVRELISKAAIITTAINKVRIITTTICKIMEVIVKQIVNLKCRQFNFPKVNFLKNLDIKFKMVRKLKLQSLRIIS